VTNELQELSRLARAWGPDPLIIQGPGGNFSAKRGESLWVKSSGALLKQATFSSGWTEVKWKSFMDCVPADQGQGTPSAELESQYTKAVGDARVDPRSARPSMELGLHTAVPETWVLHNHSLAGIVVGLASEADADLGAVLERVRGLKFAVIRLPPLIPGLELTWAFSAELRKNAAVLERTAGALWLLENHGLVWSGSKLDRVVAAAEEFETEAAQRLQLRAYPFPTWGESNGERFLDFDKWPSLSYREEVLFPDYAVFFPAAAPVVRGRKVYPPADKTRTDPDTVAELIFAHALVSTLAIQRGCLRPLPASMARQIAQLEIEKLRLAQVPTDVPNDVVKDVRNDPGSRIGNDVRSDARKR
jgi:ribulose-5-phosphate 4-epimerase/fuculose-1-phosphate aldolase